jgi:hypothetical protein
MSGNGLNDLVRDIAEIKSAVLRATLDALRQSIDPRVAADEDHVELDDLLNQELGGVIRTQGNPSQVLMPFAQTFTGAAGISLLDYLDTVKTQRTGQTRESQGLNADAMQSTTQVGIAAMLSSAQERIEMIARIFAETGIKDLYMGVQRLVMRHQDKPRTTRLRGVWVESEPSTWKTPLDVIVNVGLGTGLLQERMQLLKDIIVQQTSMLEKMGPTDLVGYRHLRNSIARVVEMGGQPDVSRYFGDIQPGWTPPQPPPKPTPEEMLVQAKAQEIQATVQLEREKRQTEMLRARIDAETKRMQMEADMQVKVYEIESRYGVTIDEARINQAVEALRASTDQQIAAIEAEAQMHTAQMQQAQQTPPTSPTPSPGG